LERIIDRAARQIGLDPAELRRRNTLRGEDMPHDAGILYRDGRQLVLDAGDFTAALETALEQVGYSQLRVEQAAARSAGRFVGIGVGCYIEGTGVGPYETARVRVTGSGEAI